ncbi:hypothetical protein J2754_000775 [Halarchaeum solikamskense]|uniref:hypothetical protein n=1 Tax=Halarchaeum nitratireducens TaxID=489913 RepID=UPI001B3A7C5B|nr:hypothetical protein [Halarchaeum solikamskense]MBP2250466.1 hypothetical protein [Halarchaeum solikamskense]
MKQNVFVSKPNGLNDRQERFWEAIEATVEARNMNIRSIGYSDYSFKTPLQKVREVMKECDGAIILGFQQKRVKDGENRAGEPLDEQYLPTPWNQLEAGMAYMLDHLMLIILETGVTDEGIFDAESSDRYILKTDCSVEWLESDEFLGPLNEWREVMLSQRE